MRIRDKSALLMACLMVAAAVASPAANARPTCEDAGGTTTCQTNGSVSIKAVPGTHAPPAITTMIPWWRGRGAYWGGY